jgi:hypothetical protein
LIIDFLGFCLTSSTKSWTWKDREKTKVKNENEKEVRPLSKEKKREDCGAHLVEESWNNAVGTIAERGWGNGRFPCRGKGMKAKQSFSRPVVLRKQKMNNKTKKKERSSLPHTTLNN